MRIFAKKIVIGLAAVALSCFFIGVGTLSVQRTQAETEATTLNSVETFGEDASPSMILTFSGSDYMTASEWSYASIGDLKWNDSITYETRTQGNAYNVSLWQYLDEYNYAEKIFIDGVALKNYSHELKANYYQRVHGLGIIFADAGIVENATAVEIKAGCELPSLLRCYFGQAEEQAYTVKEDVTFRMHNGFWTFVHSFDGYEEGVKYDASEENFYLRNADGNYLGHTEAPNCEFTKIFANEGTDDGYALASLANTEKGNVIVFEFINPINVAEFGRINLRVHVFAPTRKLAAYNAYHATGSSLGTPLETVEATLGWSELSLSLPLYANEKGTVDMLVLQFLNDGKENVAENQFFLGYFTVEKVGLVHEQSLNITENEDDYRLQFRFNKRGALQNETLDASKVSINGVTLETLAVAGALLDARWTSAGGVYQIDVTLDKAYTGEGQIRNAQTGYGANVVRVEKGLAFPNGELLEDTYVYSLYRLFTDLFFETEAIIVKEATLTFAETKATGISWRIDPQENNNLHFTVSFDQRITNVPYYHACEAESWRERALQGEVNLYNKSVSTAFVQGGYKSSLMECISINGKTIGEFHADNTWTTCVFVSYGQLLPYTMEMCVASEAPEYAALRERLENGELTIEIGKGLQFTTGYRTERDYVFHMMNGQFVLSGASAPAVFYDGRAVASGDVIEAAFAPSTACVSVRGAMDWSVEETVTEDGTSFTVRFDGNECAFLVKQTEQPQKEGCGASLSGLAACTLLMAAAVVIGRKRDE